MYLHGDYPDAPCTLQYFMMTETERLSALENKDQLQATLIWPWKDNYDLARFSATDETFKSIHSGELFAGIDTERKVIRYTNTSGENKELSYGDM